MIKFDEVKRLVFEQITDEEFFDGDSADVKIIRSAMDTIKNLDELVAYLDAEHGFGGDPNSHEFILNCIVEDPLAKDWDKVWWYVATLSCCVVVLAKDEQEARELALPSLRKILDGPWPVIRTVRPATRDEVALHGSKSIT